MVSFVLLFKVAQVKYNPNFSHNVQKTNSFIIIYRSHDKSKKNHFWGNGSDSCIRFECIDLYAFNQKKNHVSYCFVESLVYFHHISLIRSEDISIQSLLESLARILSEAEGSLIVTAESKDMNSRKILKFGETSS